MQISIFILVSHLVQTIFVLKLQALRAHRMGLVEHLMYMQRVLDVASMRNIRMANRMLQIVEHCQGVAASTKTVGISPVYPRKGPQSGGLLSNTTWFIYNT